MVFLIALLAVIAAGAILDMMGVFTRPAMPSGPVDYGASHRAPSAPQQPARRTSTIERVADRLASAPFALSDRTEPRDALDDPKTREMLRAIMIKSSDMADGPTNMFAEDYGMPVAAVPKKAAHAPARPGVRGGGKSHSIDLAEWLDRPNHPPLILRDFDPDRDKVILVGNEKRLPQAPRLRAMANGTPVLASGWLKLAVFPGLSADTAIDLLLLDAA